MQVGDAGIATVITGWSPLTGNITAQWPVVITRLEHDNAWVKGWDSACGGWWAFVVRASQVEVTSPVDGALLEAEFARVLACEAAAR